MRKWGGHENRGSRAFISPEHKDLGPGLETDFFSVWKPGYLISNKIWLKRIIGATIKTKQNKSVLTVMDVR